MHEGPTTCTNERARNRNAHRKIKDTQNQTSLFPENINFLYLPQLQIRYRVLVVAFRPKCKKAAIMYRSGLTKGIVTALFKGVAAAAALAAAVQALAAPSLPFPTYGFNCTVDIGTVNLIPLPTETQLADYTAQVWQNNHWDLAQNVQVGPKYVNPKATPVAIPEHIGEPSLIKHVFLIIKENRVYDQVFGDISTANGSAGLAVFAPYTPNQHALFKRFAALDNVYAPARQSSAGHPWIVAGIDPYENESQSPYWIRGQAGGNRPDEMVQTPRGFLWDAALAHGLSVRLYGEWSGQQIISGSYSWSDWYAYSQFVEGKIPTNPTTITPTTDTEKSTVPSVIPILDPHYPTNTQSIPDQYRADYC